MNTFCFVIIALVLCCVIILQSLLMAKERKELISFIFCKDVNDINALSGKSIAEKKKIKKTKRHVFGQVEAGDD